MTMFSLVGIGIWVLMVILGLVIKMITRSKVQGVDGLKGFVNRREAKKYGEVVAKF